MIDELNPGPFEECVGEPNPELQFMDLSECAFYGTSARQFVHTMKVNGLVNGQVIRILLDSGNSHNFTYSKLLRQ